MSQAIFALAGALVGVLGTVLTELSRSRREEQRFRELHGEARIHYERLRLLTESRRAQEAARYALRHAWSLILRCEGRPPRNEEGTRGALALLYDTLSILLTETRRELGVAHPDDIFTEPEEWLVFPNHNPPYPPAI